MTPPSVKSGGTALLAIYAFLVLWAVAPVMRESDQASLLKGAIELARDGQLVRSDYNYSKQYGSYWLIGLSLRLSNLQQVGSSPDSVVLLGNLISSLVFLSGLACLILRQKFNEWWQWVLVLSVLFCPTLFFSSCLLSSNLISTGFLCFLVCSLGVNKAWLRIAGSGVFGFLAVSTRADAVLLLPLISLLNVSGFSWRKLFSDPAIWLLGFVSIGALLLGKLLGTEHVAHYAAFFQPPVAFAYLSFGLGGGALALLVIVFGVFPKRRTQLDVQRILVVLALFLPLCFYGRILFSPRHLMTTAMVVLFFVCFETGRGWLSEFFSNRLGKSLGVLVLLTTFLPFLFGVRLSSMRSGSVVLTTPTLYPTADGYWPMGNYGQFYGWLRRAHDSPLDHNQRVWSAWKAVEKIPNEGEGLTIRSSGLVSFGKFRLILLGGAEPEAKESEVFLTDSRTISRRLLQVSGGTSRDLYHEGKVRGVLLGEGSGEEVILCNQTKDELSGSVELRKKLREMGGGDDYVLMSRSANWIALRGGGPFRWLFFSKKSGGKIGVREMVGGESGYQESQEAEVWIARSALPSFFRLKAYEN